MAIVHPIGQPMDNYEKRAIGYLEKHLPDSYHVYHNLELVPKRGGHPYEYDLIVVGRLSVWVIEVKGYGGAIRGNASDWALPIGRTERSPIPLVNIKARVLKTNLTRSLPRLGDMDGKSPVYVDALVVLCGSNAKIDLDDPQADRVVDLPGLVSRLVAHEKKLGPLNPSQDISLDVCGMLDQRFGPLSLEKRIGDYIVEGTAVSRGQYSATYLAKHALLKSQPRVALKVFRLDTSLPPSELQRMKDAFLREAEALSILGAQPHGNIARCYQPFAWQADLIVIPLEWIDGPTLRKLLDDGPRWSFRRRLGLFRQMCAGLAHAHKYGVFHRALSPDNVVLARGNQVKLVNFGLAKVDQLKAFTVPSLSTRLLRMADMRYMAPELVQCLHQPSPATDIFSAGVVLFELMTGQRPFGRQRPTQLKRITALDNELPSDIDDLFFAMCRLDPQERCRSMTDVLKRIDAIAAR